jgi:hypothetical protein
MTKISILIQNINTENLLKSLDIINESNNNDFDVIIYDLNNLEIEKTYKFKIQIISDLKNINDLVSDFIIIQDSNVFYHNDVVDWVYTKFTINDLYIFPLINKKTYDNNVEKFNSNSGNKCIVVSKYYFKIMNIHFNLNKFLIHQAKNMLKLNIILTSDNIGIIYILDEMNDVKKLGLNEYRDYNKNRIQDSILQKIINIPNIFHYITDDLTDNNLISLNSHIQHHKYYYHIIWTNNKDISSKLLDNIIILNKKDFNECIKIYGGIIGNLNYICKTHLSKIIQYITHEKPKNYTILFNKKQNSYLDIIHLYNNFNKKVNKTTLPNVIFFKINNLSEDFNYYFKNMQRYYAILKHYDYNVLNVEIDLYGKNYLYYPEIINHFNKTDIFFIDDIVYYILIKSYNELNDNKIKTNFENVFKESKYIYCFSEYYNTDDLQYIGCNIKNKEFALMFLKNAKMNLILNTKNLNYLLKNNIDNFIYFPTYGYSDITNICKIPKNPLNIDLLFYGNRPSSSSGRVLLYREKLIDEVTNYSNSNKLKFEIKEYFYDKDNILSQTKIVLHFPPYENFHVISWAKIVELMSKQIFFMIEENEELYIQKLEHIIPFYKRNNIKDLQNKINYYLKNEKERDKHIMLCYNYIKNTYNIDEFLPKLCLSI